MRSLSAIGRCKREHCIFHYPTSSTIWRWRIGFLFCKLIGLLLLLSVLLSFSCRYSISPPHFVAFLSSSVLPSPVVSLLFPPLSSTVEVYCAYPPQSLFSNCTAYIGSVRIVSILILPSIHLNMLSLLLRDDTMKPTSAPISYSRTSEKV